MKCARNMKNYVLYWHYIPQILAINKCEKHLFLKAIIKKNGNWKHIEKFMTTFEKLIFEYISCD